MNINYNTVKPVLRGQSREEVSQGRGQSRDNQK